MQIVFPTRKIAFLSALILISAAIELIIPKPLPFFRLGLANIILLLSLLILNSRNFLILSLLKVFINSFISGTLLSQIFLISFASNLLSALSMFLLFKLFYNKNLISFIGISLISSLFYNLSLIYLSSLLLFSNAIWYIAPLLLTLGFISSIITGFLANNLKSWDFIQIIKIIDPKDIIITSTSSYNEPLLTLLILPLIYLSNYIQLFILAIILTIFSLLLNKTIRLKPTLLTFIIILLSNIFIKKGLVLYENSLFTLTKDSLINAIRIFLFLYSLLRIGSIIGLTRIKGLTFFSYISYYQKAIRFNKVNQILESIKNAYLNPEITIEEKREKNKKNIFFFSLLIISSYFSFFLIKALSSSILS